jgi:hypothetical protein
MQPVFIGLSLTINGQLFQKTTKLFVPGPKMYKLSQTSFVGGP